VTEFAKGHDDTRLTLLNDKEATDQQKEADDRCHHACADAGTSRIAGHATAVAATAALATKQTIQALIEIAPQLVKIRRTVVGSLIVLAGFLAIIAGASAPARIIQRKQETKFVDEVSEHAVAFRGMVFFNRE
jgi:hypothetical protein